VGTRTRTLWTGGTSLAVQAGGEATRPMELFLKRYFWTVWLAFIALAAWLVARTANVYVAAAIEPAPHVDVSSRNTKPAAPASIASLDVASFGHLFGIDPPPPPEPTAGPEVAAPE